MDSGYYRTFVALPVTLGKGALDLVDELRDSLRSERISWVRPDQYHLTLRFLGDTPVGQVRHIGETLQALAHLPADTLRLRPPASFGPRKRPRVLYLGLEPSAILDKAHVLVESVLGRCGWPPGDLPFSPHLTLGRIRSLKDIAGYHRTIEELGKREWGEAGLTRLVYFRSVLGSGGSVYTPLAEIPLI